MYNLSFYSNPEFDKLIDRGAGEEGVDRKKAAETYQKAQEFLVDDAVALFAGSADDVVVKQKSLKGYVYYPSQPYFWFYSMYRE